MAAKRQFHLFHDQLQTPLERAVYWTEFVIKHGTEHLKMGSRDLPLYQRSLIDVYLILIISAIIPLLLTVVCLRICCRRKVKANKEKKEN
jgi:glucuronosyltransferase